MTIAFSSSLFGLVTSLILGLYEIISKGVKQTYFEFCESQIRLYYKASSNQRVSSSSNDNSELVSKLSELINTSSPHIKEGEEVLISSDNLDYVEKAKD